MAEEDYDNLETFEEENEGGGLRWMSIAIAMLAIGGFFTLAWYAYHAGTESMNEGDVPVIQAEDTPMKEAPEEPGGWQAAHQDKTVYEVISSNRKDGETVEKILPSPEEPMDSAAVTPQEPEEIAPTTPQIQASEEPAIVPSESVAEEEETAPAVNDSARMAEMEAALDKAKAQDLKPVGLSPLPVPSVAASNDTAADTAPAQTAVKDTPAVPAVKDTAPQETAAAKETPTQQFKPPVTAEAEEEKPAAVSAPVATAKAKVVQAKKEEPKPSEIASVAKVQPAAGSSSSSKQRVQLGSYRSEAEAQSGWTKISKKFPQLSGKSHSISRADLGAKGTYYRLQVMPFASADDAKKLCNTLSAKGQGCMPIAVQ